MDPFSIVMAGSMAADVIKQPFEKAKQKRNLSKDIRAAKKRLEKDDNITGSSAINTIKQRQNNRIEREALDIEASKEV